MRHHTRFTIVSILTLMIIAATFSLHASAGGKIEGTITDAKTGEPVVQASVLIVGTVRGAMTDFDGKYTISEVERGTYTLRVSHLQYNTVKVNGIIVQADSTTEQSFKLERKPVELDQTISVVGDQDALMIHEVSNQSTITKEEIERQPVTTVDELLSQVAGVVTNPSAKMNIRGGRASESRYIVDGVSLDALAYPPAHGGNAIVNGEAFDAMFFKNYGVNPFVDTEDDHLSTFATDVDDASFIMTRSYLNRGALPPTDAVRVEEFVNHFDYNYAAPDRDAFEVYVDGAHSQFGTENVRLLRIGIKGKEVRPENRKPANLTFVVDVSGSMGREDRLGLVRKSLRLLLDELNERDRVGIVVYGSNGRVILEPTSITDKDRIVRAIEQLHPNGSTNAEEGLRLGYEMAQRQFQEGHINRVMLCSDGVANVGRTGPDAILKQIKQYAEQGITLTSVGFGMGNFNDVLLEKLGNKGNGFYAYVDNLAEAKRVFVDNLTGTLQVIARDVKIQVDFNPDIVRSYRLLGYENRDVDDDKFRDDKEDGGEIGAGHEVTALYEVKLWDRGGKEKKAVLGTVFIRYKDPDHGEVTEISRRIGRRTVDGEFASAAMDLRLSAAAAEFSEILRKSYWARGSELADVLTLVKGIAMETDAPQVIELMGMVSRAQQYETQLAEK